MARFLTAEWRYLAMLNYEVEPSVVAALVPAGTELDAWGGKTFVSVVGFRFLATRVLGIGIPFHRDFDEVKLRFYGRGSGPEGWRRGVVFVKEIVPRAAIAWVARALYNERYVARRCDTFEGPDAPGPDGRYCETFDLRPPVVGSLRACGTVKNSSRLSLNTRCMSFTRSATDIARMTAGSARAAAVIASSVASTAGDCTKPGSPRMRTASVTGGGKYAAIARTSLAAGGGRKRLA